MTPEIRCLARFLRYWYTLRHLRAIQLYGRVWFRLYHPSPDGGPAPDVRAVNGTWVKPAALSPSLVNKTTFTFLNETHTLIEPSDWDDPDTEKLWRYNLHYFRDLTAENAEDREAWHRHLIERWITENPPARGTGWEPYPTSLRIVNWVKWALAGNSLPPVCLQSLAIQARWLYSRLECHLLGNHLLSNAKALVFAGLFFQGTEATQWLQRGSAILKREIAEQILDDGGQFERSTMYHSLALEDVLDLCNIAAVYREALPVDCTSSLDGWRRLAGPMRRWLKAMCHPDGEISFFNDAAIGIAPSLEELEAYAARLGLEPSSLSNDRVTYLSDSGYIRFRHGDAVALLDVAPVGPDYLPAHAHADSLSFELSLFDQRVVVNSGTSCYGNSEERLRQRSTGAHNTVVIEGKDSSEVWGGFRVGRRARPHVLPIEQGGSTLRVKAYHNGYERLPGRNIHQRYWTVSDGEFSIQDEIRGPFVTAEARFHLHPSIQIERLDESDNEVMLQLPQGQKARISVKSGMVRLEPSTWHPEFGRSEPNCCVVVAMLEPVLTTTIRWNSE